MSRGWSLRFVQIDIELLAARIALGRHDVLDIVQKGVETFIDNQARFLLGLFELLVLVLWTYPLACAGGRERRKFSNPP